MLRTNFPPRLEDDFEAFISDEASIAASERCSPNSMEWEGVANHLAESEEFRTRMHPHFMSFQGFALTEQFSDVLWPVFQPRKVFHVGSMDPAAKGMTHNAASHEGNGLSISLHPETWRHIARLSDEPTWVLNREGARFLDAHSLTQAHRDISIQWAEAQGLVEMTAAAQVSYDDLDANCRACVVFDMTSEDGRRNANEEMADIDPEAKPKINFMAMPRATQAMSDRVGFKVPLLNAADIALTCFAEDVLHSALQIDGVWWEDDFSPDNLSAPRGVIHLSALPSWEVRQHHEYQAQRLRGA